MPRRHRFGLCLARRTRNWIKNGFIRALTQSGTTRHAKPADVPTIHELLESHKAADATRRVAKVLLGSGGLGRPCTVQPGTPPACVQFLRAAFTKTMNDPDLLADAKKRGWDMDLLAGEDLEKIAKEVIVEPADVIERVKKCWGASTE